MLARIGPTGVRRVRLEETEKFPMMGPTELVMLAVEVRRFCDRGGE